MLKTVQTILFLVIFLLLTGCDSTDQTLPLAPPEIAWVDIEISPSWVEAPWTLRRFSTIFEGVGDSLLVLNKAGEYQFYGATVDNMIRDPFPSPLIGEATFGDTLTLHLDYAQTGWGRIYPKTQFGSWFDLFLLDNGGAIVCGYEDGHPRVAVVDRNGLLVVDEILPEEGYFSQIIPLDTESILLGGDGANGIALSARNFSGQELWSHSPDLPDDHSFQCLVPNSNGGFLLLANSCNETPRCSPTLALLDGTGQVLSYKKLEGSLHQAGLSVAPRASGGYFLLWARQNEGKTTTYTNEIVQLDADCNIEQIIEFGTGSSGFSGHIIACANGDVVFTFHNHEDDVTTDAVRLSDSGHTIWQINLEAAGMQVLNVCEESPNGNLLLAGYSYNGVPIDCLTWLVELSPSGEILRNKQCHMGTQRFRINMARTAWDGGLFTAGQFGHHLTGSAESWLNRTQIDWFYRAIPENTSE